MNHRIRFGNLPAGNPLANALMLVVGLLAIGAAIVLGFFAFVVLSAVVLVLAAVVGIRLWWFTRKLRAMHPPPGKREGKTADGVIEGEYTVVSTRRKPTPKD